MINIDNYVCTGCFRIQRTKKILVYVNKKTKEVVLVTDNNLYPTEEFFKRLHCKKPFCTIPISKKNILLIDGIGEQLAVKNRNDASIINKCRYIDRIR